MTSLADLAAAKIAAGKKKQDVAPLRSPKALMISRSAPTPRWIRTKRPWKRGNTISRSWKPR
jgi:hypothetical protein